MNLFKLSPLLLAAALCSTTLHAERAKLLQLGWCQPDSTFLREHWETIDRTAPFDGIAITAEFDWKGTRYEDHGVLQAEAWPREALRPALENIRQAKFTKVTHNFVRVNSPQKYIDWFDDAKWNAAIANVANMAWLAKEAGLKGLCYDPEQYASSQYTWQPATGKSFEETARMARQRGAEMMKAIGHEYPEVTVWALWLFSKTLPNCSPQDAPRALAGMDYNLWPSFLNGWLDALPEKARLIDGMEDGYYMQDIAELADTYAALKNPESLALATTVAPENREKYRKQVSVSFGLYLDAYLDGPESAFHLGPLRGISRLDRMRQTLTAALDIADDYVWLYNEQVRWWPIQSPIWKNGGRFLETSLKRPGKGKIAEEAFPGITETINLARTPEETAPRWVANRRAELENKLQNAALVCKENATTPEHWWSYGDDLLGKLMIDQSPAGNQIHFSNLQSGLLAQNIVITPGRMYYVEAKVRQAGEGNLALRIRWQSANSKWNNILRDRTFMPPVKNTSSDEWHTLSGTVSAPQGSSQMVVYFSGYGQKSRQDQAWIKDIVVYEIP